MRLAASSLSAFSPPPSSRKFPRRHSIPSCIGSPSSRRQPWVQRWRISPIVRSASVISADTSILFAGLIASLAVWRWSEGSVSVNTVATPRVEMFYWVAILFSQTLGTALGDWMADTNGLGYEGGAAVFAAGLAVVAAAYFYTNISHTLLFWAAFILTRPLGATLGDLLDKPHAHGGLEISRYVASGILAAVIVALILILPQRAGVHPGAQERKA